MGQKSQLWRPSSFVIALGMWLCVIILFITMAMLCRREITEIQAKQERQGVQCMENLASVNTLEEGVRRLTESVWRFAATGELPYAQAYLQELEEDRHREQAIDDLRLRGLDEVALSEALSAKKVSDGLSERELWAMRLLYEAIGGQLPVLLEGVFLSREEQALTPQEKIALAQSYLFGVDYEEQKAIMRAHLDSFRRNLNTQIKKEMEEMGKMAEASMARQSLMDVLIIAWLLLLIVGLYGRLIRPVWEYSHSLSQQSGQGEDYAPLDLRGSRELKTLGRAFNHVLIQLQEAKERLVLQNQELTVLSHTDHLTKTLNRLAMENYLQNLLKESRGSDEPIGITMVDVDHFKAFNDRYGHPLGDEALRQVAERLQARSEEVGGMVSRMGGEEFLILFAGQGEDALTDMAEQLRRDVETLDIKTEAGQLNGLTISLGSYVYHGGEESLRQLYIGADKALYAAKNRGRNCHIGFWELEEPRRKPGC